MEIQIDHTMIEELMKLARDNRTMLIHQGETLTKMQNTLVGNGSSQSVVARLLLVEERQKESAAERRAMREDIAKMSACMDRIDKEGTEEYHRINQLEKGQAEILGRMTGLEEGLKIITETVNNWKQRGIGFSLGMAAVAGGSFAGILKLLDAIFQ